MISIKKKPLAVVLGAAFVLAGPAAQASVFQASDLGAGYMVASAGDDKAGEHKCGENKGAEMGEKKGADNGEKTGHDKKAGEGKCGEGKCGEGKCGEKK
ncbi:MAG: low-complexity protein [Panacagrimonas sp.]|jgi:uncharacterized low-complexity protein|nr:hypothetical protein [Panacagrimonas sp.]MCC2655595.1 low-complexity protein [Panacagrimonas sp.]